MTIPTDLRALAALLRDQAPKRFAKRQPELDGIPGPAMLKIADALDVYTASLPDAPGPVATIPETASLLQPITGSPALAELESAARTQDSIDLTRYGFRAPWPTALTADDCDPFDPEADPRTPAELAEAFAALPGVQPDDWLRSPTAVPLGGEPAADGHYAPGTPTTAGHPVPKGEAGEEPAYRLQRSVSQLTSYGECGLRYKRKYVERVAEVPAIWNIGGRAFHEVARRFETDRATDGQLMSADDAAKAFADMFDLELDKTAAETEVPREQWKAASSGKETVQWWFDKGPEMAAKYVEHALKSGDRPLMLGNDAPALELKLTGWVGGVATVAYLDHVAVNHSERRIKIKDYKTGSRLPVDPAQLLTYGTLLRTLPADLLPPSYEVHGEYWAARKGTVSGSKPLAPAAMLANAQRFDEFDKAERAGIYLANPTTFCSACPVKSSCPIMSSHKGASEPVSDENLRFTE